MLSPILLVSSADNLQHKTGITINTDGGVIQHHPDGPASQAKLTATTKDDPEQISIHIRRHEDKELSDEDASRAADMSEAARQSASGPIKCQKEINKLNAANKRNNELLLKITEFEIHLRELQEENESLRQQLGMPKNPENEEPVQRSVEERDNKRNNVSNNKRNNDGKKKITDRNPEKRHYG